MKRHETNKLENSKQKQRHIVSWTPEEDDLLREQIKIHGIENWTVISSQFKDKTTRQCRRRWYTYLNVDCKKGGWSPEEDMLLCEAQQIFGNKWTEIAKVVSGRTDNAVKNRFSTLCKKRAKHEALHKENKHASIDQNNNNCLVQGHIVPETSESAVSHKKTRTHMLDFKDTIIQDILQRTPLSKLTQNFNNVCSLPNPLNEDFKATSSSKIQSFYLKEDNPKIMTLMQQVELLGSLAEKHNKETCNRSLENAWKELKDFLNWTKEHEQMNCKLSEVDGLLGNLKYFVKNLNNDIGDYHLKMKSECSTNAAGDAVEVYQNNQDGKCSVNQTDIDECTSDEGKCEISKECKIVLDGETGIINEFGSPLQMIPSCLSFPEEVLSPKFSESERQFLARTLGLMSPSSEPKISTPKAIPCKRILFDSLTNEKSA